MWRSALSIWTWTTAGGVSYTDYFTSTRDMNTAILKFLNVYYGTSYQDIQQPLARYLHEDTAHDIQNRWQTLLRHAQGKS
jgi:hypothetical protein